MNEPFAFPGVLRPRFWNQGKACHTTASAAAWAHHPISLRTRMAFNIEEEPRSIMKRLRMAVVTVVLFTGGCSNSRNVCAARRRSRPSSNCDK